MMYRINPLMRDVLITTDEVIFHAPTKQQVDPRAIQNSIIVAEERFIRPAICDDFYSSLVSLKNKEVTADNKESLQQQIADALPEGSEPVTLNIGNIVNALEFLSGDNLTLWKQHLWKLTAECVMMLAMPDNFVQFGAEGVVHMAPPASPLAQGNIVSPELKSVKWAMDKKLMDRIDPLIEAMHAWICKRKDKYPLYCKACDCDANGVAYKRKTDMILGLYDDEDDIHSNNCGCY